MNRSRSFAIAFLLLAILSIFAQDAFAKRKWWIGGDEDFVFYSNASKKSTEQLYRDLHEAKSVFGMLFPALSQNRGIPLRGVFCNDDKTLKELVPLYDGKPKAVGGIFTSDNEGSFMLVGDFDGETRHVLIHEYIHYLTRGRGFYMAPWLGEGLAELFSTIEASQKKGQVKVGYAIPGRVYRLHEDGFMDFEKFFRVTHGSKEYNSAGHGVHVFYAQAWLLQHYMLFGKHGLGGNAFSRLVEFGIKNAWPTEDAFEAVFGIRFDQLEKDLRRYSNSGKYSLRIYSFPEEHESKELVLREASLAETELIYGFALLRNRGGAK